MGSLKSSVVFAVVFFLSMSVVHEETHRVVAESYGCDTETQYIPDLEAGTFMSVTYTCEGLSQAQYNDLRMTQNQVELVGYPILLFSTFALFCLLLIALEVNKLTSIVEQLVQSEEFAQYLVDSEESGGGSTR